MIISEGCSPRPTCHYRDRCEVWVCGRGDGQGGGWWVGTKVWRGGGVEARGSARASGVEEGR